MLNINFTEVEKINKVIENAVNQLKNYSTKIDIKSLEEVKNDLNKKIEDFNNEDRKLRIGIIGQIKAGKSSFINSLLFKGEDILPKAATPKTANLTVIKYNTQNSLNIEFYTKKEFNDILKRADFTDESNETKVAKEIKKLYDTSGISIDNFSENFIIKAENYNDLLGKLDEYAGEKGKYTAIVKSLVLNINNEKLKDIEIVDTPGMNDPILSRTEKTREFMKFADVVFFLSPSTQFLDNQDMDLLIKQLPQNGVQCLILLASKFDSAVLDDGWNRDSFDECISHLKSGLTNLANKNYKDFFKQVIPENIKTVIKNSLPPVFISSMAYNLLIKNKYSKEEKSILNELNEIWDNFEFSKSVLKEIANFDEVNSKFDNVILKKEDTLKEKLKNILPNIIEKYITILKNFLNTANNSKDILQNDKIGKIKENKSLILKQKHQISLKVEEVLGNLKPQLTSGKGEVLKHLRNDITKYSEIKEQTGTEVHESSHWVSTSSWYNPFSWGGGYTATSTYTTTYKYYMAADAIEALTNFVNSSKTNTEKNFEKILESKSLKFNLKKALLEVLDTSSDDFSPEHFKLIIEEVVNNLEYPVIKMDVSDTAKNISQNFSGEIKGGQMSDLKIEVNKSLEKIYNQFEEIIIKETEKNIKIIEEMKSKLLNNLLSKIDSDIENLEKEYKNKEEEVIKYTDLINILEKLTGDIYAK